MSRAERIIIQGSLPGLNEYIAAERGHRQRAATMKRECQNLVAWQMKPQLRGVRLERPVIIAFAWYERDNRRDPDNISAYGRKVILDALVELGVLSGDGRRQIRGFGPERFGTDKAEPRIEILIEEVEG